MKRTWLRPIKGLVIASCVLFATVGYAQKTLSLFGYVTADVVYLTSPYGGKVVSLPVKAGQKIKANQIVFKLDPHPQSDNVRAQRQNVKSSQCHV